MKNVKRVEYYYDSNIYTKKELIENFSREKEKYNSINKTFEMDIELNQWGVYIVKLEFKNKSKNKNVNLNKNATRKEKKALVKKKPSKIKNYNKKLIDMINTIKELFTKNEYIHETKLDKYYRTNKNKKIEKNIEKLQLNYNTKKYGQYKETKKYKPL